MHEEPGRNEQGLSARDAGLLFALALALRAAAFRPALPPAPTEALLLGSEPGAPLFIVRLLATLAGALAPLLLARAAARLAGRPAAIAAGGLLALTPFAVRHAGWVGPPGLLLLAASGGLLHLVRWVRMRKAADLAALGAWAAPAVLALGWAPLTNVADRGAVSPLLEGTLRVGALVNPIVLALAIGGFLVAHRRAARPGERAAARTTAGLFLLVLLREGPDPNALAVALPGACLLAALALAALPGGASRWVSAGRVALGAAGLLALGGSVVAIAQSRSHSPAEDAQRWTVRHMAMGSAVVVSEPDVHLPVFAPERARKGFQPVALPPDGVSGDEAAIFYDPDLVRHFPAMILRDPPPNADPRLLRFHRYFTREWRLAFRTGQDEYPHSAVSVLVKPAAWKADSAQVAALREELQRGSLDAVQDTSSALTAWVAESARAMRASGDLDSAELFLAVAKARGLRDPGIAFETALLQIHREDWGTAMSSLLDCLQQDTGHGSAHYNLGTLLEREDDLDGAETEYRAAILYLEDPAPAHARLGALLAIRGRLEEAEEELRTVSRLRPGSQAEELVRAALAEARSGESGGS